jgi:hypothetical protein
MMTLPIFEVSDAGVSPSDKGDKKKAFMASQVGWPADRLYRYQNIVSIGERAISFCMVIH